MTSAAAGWEIARLTWRRQHRRGLAVAGALVINSLVLTGFVASIHSDIPRDARAIAVTLVPPFVFEKAKPVEPKTEPAPTQAAHVHTTAASAAPKPATPAPLPPTPLPKGPPALPAAGRWTPTPDLHSRLDDQPSAQRYLRAGSACSKGELWKMPREEQDKCLDRWARVMPKDEDGMHRHPPPNDPGGQFARAAAALEEQRRPMPSGTIGQCDLDVQGTNLHRFCPPTEKGSAVQQLEGQPK